MQCVRAQNVIALFFRLGWDWYRFDKNHTTTRCAELVFFNPAGYTGHVAHSVAFESSNVTALLLMLGWDWYGFD
jgi:hypothetical protein